MYMLDDAEIHFIGAGFMIKPVTEALYSRQRGFDFIFLLFTTIDDEHI
jgi:hypothetical protein